MAVNFPNSPTDGQLFSAGGVTYKYISASSRWDRLAPSTVNDYTDLVNKPSIPADVSDLTDTTSLLGSGTASALGTLTKTFSQNEEAEITLSQTISPVPSVSVFKEIPQGGITAKGNWDVSANGANYDFLDEKPISYSSTTLTPSATGDGNFTLGPTTGYVLSAASILYKGHYIVGYNNYWPQALWASNDGTRVYYCGQNDMVLGFTVSNPFNWGSWPNESGLSAVTASSNEYITGYGAFGIAFKPDGSKFYMLDQGSNLFEWTLGTAWNIGQDLSGGGITKTTQSGFGSASHSLRFKPDGTQVFGIKETTGRIYSATLSTPWDITTMTMNNIASGKSADYLQLSANVGHISGFDIHPDGDKIICSAQIGSVYGIFQVGLSSAWDFSNATQNPLDGSGVVTYTDLVTQGTHDGSTFDGGSDSTHYTARQRGGAGVMYVDDGKKLVVISSYAKYVALLSIEGGPSFSASDVGKIVTGNSGSATITSTAGAYSSITAFADTSMISSWTLIGAQGKADGSGIELSGYSLQSDIVFPTGASGAGASMAYNNNVSPITGALSNVRSVAFNNEGTIALVCGNGKLQRWNLTTAFDLSTLTEAATDNFDVQLDGNDRGLYVKPDGTRVWISNYSSDLIKQFTLSTPWSPSTQTYDGYYRFNFGGKWNSFSGSDGAPSSNNFNPFDFQFNSDGTKLITLLWDNAPYHAVAEFTLSTGWDMSTISYTSYANLDSNIDPEAIAISPDGLKLMVHGYEAGVNSLAGVEIYSLPSAFSVGSSGSNLTKTSGEIDIATLTGMSGEAITYGGLTMSYDGKRLWVVTTNSNRIWEITGGTTSVHPYSTYSPTVTGTTGQINTSAWVDIDSMVADETKNGGDVFYAVSTDNKTSWGVIKDGSGVRKIAKNNSGTWQYNNDAGSTSSYDIAGASYNNKRYDFTSVLTIADALAVKPDGTKFYIGNNATGDHRINQFSMTNGDISTGSSDSKSQTTLDSPNGVRFKPDGSKMIVVCVAGGVPKVQTFSLSTPWDVSTASQDSAVNCNVVSGAADSPRGIAFKPDGTKAYILASNDDKVWEWSLTSPWDFSTASISYLSDFVSIQVPGQSDANPYDLEFSADGSMMFILDAHGNDTLSYAQAIWKWTLSTPWDITTASTSVSSANYILLSASNSIFSESNFMVQSGAGMARSDDGTKLYISIARTGYRYVWQIEIGSSAYATSETWVNSTTNNELAALQQALGAQAFNRMDKAQLQSVSDANQYTLGNTLDLMIAPYAASGVSPISDGVTVGYQAEALIRQAINGTDYEAEFPTSNKVKIKSLAGQNLKIRII